ncbi:MAG: hypothetical protein IKS87_09215 [Lachnospiraceae bacterium]|nr:hypothetical protein [Lachnospiraceae bacterium]
MGIFTKDATKFCPVCGRQITGGLSTQRVADGEVCVMCWQAFREISQADMSAYTVSQVADIIEGKEMVQGGEIAGDGAFCPACGEPMQGNAKAIADSVICSRCERLERAMYFIDPETGEDELDDVRLKDVIEDYGMTRKRFAGALAKCGGAGAVAYVDEATEENGMTSILIGVAKGAFQSGDTVTFLTAQGQFGAQVVAAVPATGNDFETAYALNPAGSVIGTYDHGWLVVNGTDLPLVLEDVVYKN